MIKEYKINELKRGGTVSKKGAFEALLELEKAIEAGRQEAIGTMIGKLRKYFLLKPSVKSKDPIDWVLSLVDPHANDWKKYALIDNGWLVSSDLFSIYVYKHYTEHHKGGLLIDRTHIDTKDIWPDYKAVIREGDIKLNVADFIATEPDGKINRLVCHTELLDAPVYVNEKFFINAMTGMISPVITTFNHKGSKGTNTAPVQIEDENRIAIVMPLNTVPE